jgi:membrane-associated phospholipid phosphatase
MKQKIARWTSGLLNPFIVCFISIILVTIHATDSTANAFKWMAIALICSIAPVFAFLYLQVKRKKLESIFPEGQSQRKLVYLIATVVAAIGYGVMWYLEAPRLLQISFLGGLLAVIIFMVINIFWKISLHAAFVSAAAVVLTVVFGAGAVWVFALLPLIGWSRLELKMHTLAQVIAGAALAAFIIVGVYWGLGVV